MNILQRAMQIYSRNPPMDETRNYGVRTTLISRDLYDEAHRHKTRRLELAVYVEYVIDPRAPKEALQVFEDDAKRQLMNHLYRDADEALYAAMQAVMNNDLHGTLACLETLRKTITYDPRAA